MRDIGRIEPVALKLAKAWATVPDMRLGQFLVNVADLQDPWEIEEAEWVRRFEIVEKGGLNALRNEVTE